MRQVDTMKRKQFVKGINQIAQEGAIQIFQEYNTGMEEIIVGVVGVLQFDVLKYRLKNEYNVEILLENLPYEYIRWIESADTDLDRISGTSDMKIRFERPAVTFVHPEWNIRMLERNDGLVLLSWKILKIGFKYRVLLAVNFFFANGWRFVIIRKEMIQNGRF